MFRIDRIYKNAQVELWKISGEMRRSQVMDWVSALKTLPLNSNRQIILDFCEVAYLSPKAADLLFDHITTHTFIVNCPDSVRNMMHAAGLSSRLLE